jgi:DNA-binding NtrC family response regulator
VDDEPKTQPSSPRRRLLLVDDDQDLLETTAALLEDDFEVLTATSGDQALQVLAKASVAVVCADYKMQGMTGLELLRAVRQRSPGTAGVLVTGMRESLDRNVMGDEAVFAVVYKPYEAQRLIETLRDAVRFASMTSAATAFAIRLKRERRHGR